MHMDAEVTSYINLPVYTQGGQFVGVVSNVLLDLPKRRIGSLLLTRVSKKLVESGMDVAIPYRWVAARGDILLLNHFPERVVAADEELDDQEVPVLA